MKNVMLIMFMAAGVLTGRLMAQTHEMGNKEKMKIFSAWVGQWKGEGRMQMGTGEPRKAVVNERIESKLEGTILMVEGVGKSTDPTTQKEIVVHHAFAVLSYDQQSGNYKFRTYLSDGRSTDAWLQVVDQNKYQWGFDSPRGKVRYSIRIDPLKNTWNEIGEHSPDGNNWTKFFEMDLAKVE
jgi:hypothetical protein